MPDTKPILLICGCQKYRVSLMAAIERFHRDCWVTVGCIGDPSLTAPIYDASAQIVFLPVADTYEALPSKMWAAFTWIMSQWPQAPGIFKTDEDIWYKSLEDLEAAIQKNIEAPYWGVRYSKIEANSVSLEKIKLRFTDVTLRPQHQQAAYCYGLGYWIGRAAFPVIQNARNEYARSVLEDVCTGAVMNQANFYPTTCLLAYEEKPR